MKSWTEKVVAYAGDLDVAAQEVIAELDDQDGLRPFGNEFKELVREMARKHRVGRKDLLCRVREYL
ncbi:MAG: hypothetical protein IPJ65_38265 [Archangiaceae bacterium]|nr:hypothetical protein [Archangiaceae bacterium]